MSDKLKVVGAKALLGRPVLRIVRGDEATTSPPTTPDPSWEEDELDALAAYSDMEHVKFVNFASAQNRVDEEPQDDQEILVSFSGHK
ncbi:MAG: hypothetical protein ACRBB0_16265 [Pelagimonas sp.]|uniref:hypothetical protein n=1 Tax=Pelagimonas sp. TaxID=2073170 RepID=UPI003D6B06F4